jgi:hypothetical protein
VLHFHRHVPTCAHDRHCDLGRLAELRAGQSQRVSWALLFIKAFSLVARQRPVLRQAWIRWPWPHLYQHPHSVGMLAIQREHEGEPWLFWGRFPRPESTPLAELQRQLDAYQSQPVERIFKKQLQFAALPTPLRRAVWSWNLNVAGESRARRAGTFFLTTLAAQGVEIPHPPAFLTSNLSYGPLDEQGRCRVSIAYDHRLTDGLQIAHGLQELERTLNGPIADELRSLPAVRRAA